MRKSWLLLFAIPLFFVGCSFGEFEYWDYEWDGGPVVTSVDEAADFVYDHVDFKDDVDGSWQLPHETHELGAGDCEDHQILFMYLIYRDLNIESSLCSYPIRYSDGTVAYYHAVVKMPNGRYYDTTSRYRRDTALTGIEMNNEWNYGRTMFLAWLM